MSGDTKPVEGVLVTLDHEIRFLDRQGCLNAKAHMQRVRDRVAELIAADLELDAAYDEFPKPGVTFPAQINAAAARINAAKLRRARALDAIQQED